MTIARRGLKVKVIGQANAVEGSFSSVYKNSLTEI